MSGILLAFSGGSYGSPPANTVAPAVTGTAQVRQTLSCSTGTWNGVPTPTFTYQWQYGGSNTNISGATSSTYQVADAYVGQTIRCVVTATNPISVVSANSNSTSAIAANVPAAPTIGTATATSASTASITFTAPSGAYATGGSAITGYTMYSSGGQSATGTSSPITITGLSSETAYNFYVRANNAIGQSSNSGTSNTITTPASYWINALGLSWSQNATKGAVDDGSGNITVGIGGNNAYGGTPTLTMNKNGTVSSGNRWLYASDNAYVYPSGVNSYIGNVGSANYPYCAWPYSDGSVVSAGYRYAPGRYGPSVQRTNSSGTSLWGLDWGASSYGGAFRFVTQGASGYIYACGQKNQYPPQTQAVMVKLDTSGNVQLAKYVSPQNESIACASGIVDNGSDIYITLSARDYSRTHQYGWIGKFNSSMGFIWGRRVSAPNNNTNTTCQFSGISMDGSGNVYAFGSVYDSGDGNNHSGCVFKWDPSGNLQWQRHFAWSGVNLAGLAGAKYDSATGYFYVMGARDGNDQFFLKMDTSGNIAYARYMTNSSNQIQNSMCAVPTSGNNIYVYGTYNIPNQSPFVMKVPADGSKTGTYSGWTYAALTSYSWYDRGCPVTSDTIYTSDWSDTPQTGGTSSTSTTTPTLIDIP